MRSLAGGAIGALMLMSGGLMHAANAAPPSTRLFFAQPAADTLTIIGRGCANDGGPSPRAFIRYTVAPDGPAVSAVTVSGWVQDSRRPPVQHTERLAGSRFEVRTQGFLLRLGGRRTPA